MSRPRDPFSQMLLMLQEQTASAVRSFADLPAAKRATATDLAHRCLDRNLAANVRAAAGNELSKLLEMS